MNATNLNTNREQAVMVQSGWVCLAALIVLWLLSMTSFIYSMAVIEHYGHPAWKFFVSGILGLILCMFLLPGFFTLQPNEARVLVLFGKYRGTVRVSGFHWGNPFYSNGRKGGGMHFEATKEKPVGASLAWRRGWRNKMSLRVRNLNSDSSHVRCGRL
jgi:hypothetical protein